MFGSLPALAATLALSGKFAEESREVSEGREPRAAFRRLEKNRDAA
jgi:hypothetical protein